MSRVPTNADESLGNHTALRIRMRGLSPPRTARGKRNPGKRPSPARTTIPVRPTRKGPHVRRKHGETSERSTTQMAWFGVRRWQGTARPLGIRVFEDNDNDNDNETTQHYERVPKH